MSTNDVSNKKSINTNLSSPYFSFQQPLENIHGKSSRIPGFYELSLRDRQKVVQAFSDLQDEDIKTLSTNSGLNNELVDAFIENGVGSFALPLGMATNFLIDDKEMIIPMAVEETSVLAAASHGAKLARAGGGFRTSCDEPISTGQIQLFVEEKLVAEIQNILEQRKYDLIAFANQSCQKLVARGGGLRDLQWEYNPLIESIIIYVHIDTRDAMGANIVNTVCEHLSAIMPSLFKCDIGLRILTNLTTQRMVKAQCIVPAHVLETKNYAGAKLVERIVAAYQFAANNIFRAATHNKGVMNGIDPIVIATGNDWRAVEAGAHAYAAMSGVYKPLTVWSKNLTGDLHGSIELPMALGVVGGVTKLHPSAKTALKILGHPSGQELACICAAVGLAQNLSALRALASEGIQRGHMSLHQRNLDLLERVRK